MAIKKFNLLGRSTGKQPTNYPLLVFGRVKKKQARNGGRIKRGRQRWGDPQTIQQNATQYSKTNQSRHPPNAPGCKMQIEQNRRNGGIRSRVNENGLKPRYRGGVGEEAESRGTDNSLYQEIVAANWAVAPIPSTVSLPSPFLFLVFPTRPALPSVSSFFLSPSFGLNNCDGPRVDINLRAIICLFSSSHSFISVRAFSRVSFSSVERKKKNIYIYISNRFVLPFLQVAHTRQLSYWSLLSCSGL